MAVLTRTHNSPWSYHVVCLWTLQHDTTVAALLSALNIYDGIQPAYSSAVIIELYSDESDAK